MELRKMISKISNNETLAGIKYNLVEKFANNEHYLNMAMSISSSISKFAESQSPLSFVEGGVGAFRSLIQLASGRVQDHFSEEHGWHQLTDSYYNKHLYDILSSVLETYPNRELRFGSDNDKPTIFELPFGELVKIRAGLFYRAKDTNKEKLLEFLINKKIQSLKSKFFVIAEKTVAGKNQETAVHRYDLIGEEIFSLPSKYADDLANYIRAFFNKGFTRSIILNGLPGAGKTVAAHEIVKQLDMPTLKFKFSRYMDVLAMQFLIKSLNIEIVLLDDFDYYSDPAELLGFLEWLNRNVKLTIAITNTLKNLPQAILRPGRFAELRTLSSLDEGVLRNVLGEFYDKIRDKVNGWPISFIVEIVKRLQTNPNLDLDLHLSELNARVEKQKKVLEGPQ